MASNERDGDLPFANYHSPIKRSPDGAQRNPGAAEKPAGLSRISLCLIQAANKSTARAGFAAAAECRI
jgi:hypothetical protein